MHNNRSTATFSMSRNLIGIHVFITWQALLASEGREYSIRDWLGSYCPPCKCRRWRRLPTPSPTPSVYFLRAWHVLAGDQDSHGNLCQNVCCCTKRCKSVQFLGASCCLSIRIKFICLGAKPLHLCIFISSSSTNTALTMLPSVCACTTTC